MLRATMLNGYVNPYPYMPVCIPMYFVTFDDMTTVVAPLKVRRSRLSHLSRNANGVAHEDVDWEDMDDAGRQTYALLLVDH